MRLCPAARLRRAMTRWSLPLGSAGLLNVLFGLGLRAQEFRILFVPEVLAGAERTELAHERTGAADEVLWVHIHSHELVVTGQPAAGDDLGHRASPSSSP